MSASVTVLSGSELRVVFSPKPGEATVSKSMESAPMDVFTALYTLPRLLMFVCVLLTEAPRNIRPQFGPVLGQANSGAVKMR